MMTKGIRNIFSQVPETYELVNHFLTFGLDVLWRRRAARIAVQSGGARWIDMCTGTGEMASYLRRFSRNGAEVYAADFCLPMLRKAAQKPDGGRINFLLSDAKNLPFPDESFDLVTISFATRNINLTRDVLLRTFEEFHRILKVDGHFVHLETSQPSSSLVRRAFHKHVELFVRPIGSRISGSRAGYAYLANTIPRFYGPEELANIMHRAGFRDISIERLMLGAAAFHHGIRSSQTAR